MIQDGTTRRGTLVLWMYPERGGCFAFALWMASAAPLAVERTPPVGSLFLSFDGLPTQDKTQSRQSRPSTERSMSAALCLGCMQALRVGWMNISISRCSGRCRKSHIIT